MDSVIIKRLEAIEKQLADIGAHLGVSKTPKISDIREQAKKKAAMALQREGKKHGR